MNRSPVQFERPDRDVIDVLRTKGPQERLSIAFGMWAAAHKMLVSLLADQHPEWDHSRLQEEVARRLSGGSF
ncbi:MAG: hypothetical protein ACC742_12325 [Thermoanaerobaculales bacterium]